MNDEKMLKLKSEFEKSFEEFVVDISLLAVKYPAKEVLAKAKELFEPLIVLVGKIATNMVKMEIDELFNELLEED